MVLEKSDNEKEQEYLIIEDGVTIGRFKKAEKRDNAFNQLLKIERLI